MISFDNSWEYIDKIGPLTFAGGVKDLLSPLLVSTPASWFSVETLMQHHHISLILYLQYFRTSTSPYSNISRILYLQYFCTSTSPYSYFSVSFSDSVPSVFFANVNVKVFLKVWSWQKLEYISALLSPWDGLTSENRFAKSCALRGNV